MKILCTFIATIVVAAVVAFFWQYLIKLGDSMEEATIWVACHLLLDLLVGYFANQRRNRSFYDWFLVSFLFSPVVGFVLVACSRTLLEAVAPDHRANNLGLQAVAGVLEKVR